MKGPTTKEKRLVLFENPFLEMLTLASIWLFAAVWIVVLPLIAFVGWGTVSVSAAVGLSLGGLLVWSLFEYIAHRHLFHWEPQWLPARQLVFAIHGNHHAQPTDHLRNLMPPIVSLPVAGFIWALCYALAGNAGTWFVFGFLAGYVLYDLTHYACHQWSMRGRIGKVIKKHHMRHHFMGEDGNFGVTTPLWDHVLDTRIGSAGRVSAKAMRELPVHPAE